MSQNNTKHIKKFVWTEDGCFIGRASNHYYSTDGNEILFTFETKDELLYKIYENHLWLKYTGDYKFGLSTEEIAKVAYDEEYIDGIEYQSIANYLQFDETKPVISNLRSKFYKMVRKCHKDYQAKQIEVIIKHNSDIRASMAKHKIKLSDLSKELNCGYRTASHYINGKKNMSEDNFVKLQRKLNLNFTKEMW